MADVKISALPVASSIVGTDVFCGDVGGVTKQIPESLLTGRSLYSAAVLADTPTFYYQCRDLSGTTCTDASGNSHNGLYVGSPLLGHAPLCGDLSDYAIHTGVITGQVGVTSSQLPSTSAFTVEGIFRSDRPDNYGRLIGTDIYSAAQGFLLAQTNNSSVFGGFQLTFNVSGSGSLPNLQVGGAASTFKDRTHVALVYTGTAVILYINGVPMYTSGAMTGAYVPSSTYSLLYFGYDPAGSSSQYVGALDELALYQSTALTATRIRAHASAMWTQ